MTALIKINTYNKEDFNSWVVKGLNNGLDDSIISRNRAIAQMNNPDADINDILITTAVFKGVCIGYRGVFPEKINYKGKRIKVGWLTTFFVDPDFRGKGIAKRLMAPIEKYYSNGIGSIHSSENAIKVYTKLGWNISFIDKSWFLFRLYKPNNYSTNTLIKRTADIFRPALNSIIGLFHNHWLRKNSDQIFELEYTNIIDDRLYSFLEVHSKNDLFFKSQERYNWILKYKWAMVSPCISRTNDKYYFANNIKDFFQCAAIIKRENNIIGFFVLRNRNGNLTVPFLHYENSKNKYVFLSILEHIIELKAHSITTSNVDLIRYINESKLARISKKKKIISYSHTKQEHFNNDIFKLQDGDGDLFF